MLKMAVPSGKASIYYVQSRTELYFCYSAALEASAQSFICVVPVLTLLQSSVGTAFIQKSSLNFAALSGALFEVFYQEAVISWREPFLLLPWYRSASY